MILRLAFAPPVQRASLADMPVGPADRVHFVINLETAKVPDFTIPRSMARALEVIE